MINRLVKNPSYPLIFRIISLIGLIFLFFIFYFGSIKLIFNFTNTWVMFLIWTLWWPFLYVSLLFLGRIWCGFLCPIGLANEMGNSFLLNKKNYLIRYSFLPFLILFLVIFWEQISGLFFSTTLTWIFLGTFLLLAFIMGIFIPRWGFCKYFCPVGTILGVFSRLSFVGLRTDKRKCSECKTKECIRGGVVPACPMYNNVPNIDSNQNCLLCTNCIKNCPHNSAKIAFVKPGEELKKKSKFYLSESLFIVALLGFSILLTSVGTQIGRFFFSFLNLGGVFLRLGDFVFWILLSFLVYFGISFLSTKLDSGKSKFNENLINGGYVFLPVVFFLMFYLIVFGFLLPFTNLNETLMAISKYILILIGGIWSIKLSISLFRKRAWVYILAILVIISLFYFAIISWPLNFIGFGINEHYAYDKEVISMDAFSMGFNPEVIYAKEGSSFKIDITSIDIAHSFDMDDFDVHMSFKEGGNLIISLNNIKEGEYEYYCAIPGHKEAGMKGVLIVK